MNEISEGATTPETGMTDGPQLKSSGSLPVDYAIHLAHFGVAAMPLQRASNLPHQMLGSGWSFSEAGDKPFGGARGEESIRSMWSNDPAANVGVVTGRPSRLLVIDMDTTKKRSPHAGAHHLNEWQSEIGMRLPEGPVVRTPSGGYHLWLRYDSSDYFPTKIGWLPNVDVKADGGQVAAPPSIRMRHVRGGMGEHRLAGADVPISYEWLRPLPSSLDLIPKAPEWLLADVLTRPAAINGSTGSTSQNASGGEMPSTEWFLANGFGGHSGSRNIDCHKLACRLWRNHWPNDDLVTSLIYEAWQATDTNGFPWTEAMTCIRSARGFVGPNIERERAYVNELRSTL